MTMPTAHPGMRTDLRDDLAHTLTVPGLAWVDAEVAKVRDDPAVVTRTFAAAARDVRRYCPAAAVDDPWLWTDADRVRALLLLATGPDVMRWADDLYRYGEAGERRAVLRALDLLDADGCSPGEPGRRLVEDALRCNDPRLVAAALGPFGVRALDDAALGQAVLKCAFLDLDPRDIPGVQERTTPTLVHQLMTLALERVLAGRSVPPGLWALTVGQPDDEVLTLLTAELWSALPHRKTAALAALEGFESVSPW